MPLPILASSKGAQHLKRPGLTTKTQSPQTVRRPAVPQAAPQHAVQQRRRTAFTPPAETDLEDDSSTVAPQSFGSGDSYDEESGPSYLEQSVLRLVRERGKYLLVFCAGLGVAATIMEHWESLVQNNVALSFFVPLIIGHGGNSGSQTVSSVIRALSLKQIRWRHVASVMLKEAAAGAITGGLIGGALMVFAATAGDKLITPDVGVVVAISLPVVSLWANSLAAFVVMASSKLKLDPALTAGPLTTTIVDMSGLLLYFMIAQAVIEEGLYTQVMTAVMSALGSS